MTHSTSFILIKEFEPLTPLNLVAKKIIFKQNIIMLDWKFLGTLIKTGLSRKVETRELIGCIN